MILTLLVKGLPRRPKPPSKHKNPPHSGTHRHVHAQAYTTMGHSQSRSARSLHLCTMIPTETSAILPRQSVGKSLGLNKRTSSAASAARTQAQRLIPNPELTHTRTRCLSGEWAEGHPLHDAGTPVVADSPSNLASSLGSLVV